MRTTKKYLLLGVNLFILLAIYKLTGSARYKVMEVLNKRQPGTQLGILRLNDTEVGKEDLPVSDDSIAARLAARKSHLKAVCKGMTLDPNVANQRGLEVTLAHGKLKFCGLEKVGSTFMKNIREGEKKASSVFKIRKDFKSFVIVREPYARLLSAYIDKLVLRSIWWRLYGRWIVGQFRPYASDKDRGCGTDITFREYIKYFIYTSETGTKKNPHFLAMSEECQFCHLDYDYYVHLETMKSDINYIYNTVNHTLNSTMVNDEDTLKQMAALVVQQRDKGDYKRCQQNCTMLSRAWWTFQIRGLVARDIQLPTWLSGSKCDTITKEEYVSVVWEAHVKSLAVMDKRRQRREMMVDLFLQVPLLERLRVRELFMKDFKLHNYDSTPRDIFPEIQ